MTKLNQQDIQAIREIVAETYRIMMEQEAHEIAQVHGKMLQTTAMIEEIATRDELDISTLGEEAEKRAYALAVTMAERAVCYAENDLIEIKKQISEVQKAVASGGAKFGNYWRSLSDCEVWLKRLLEQEQKAVERLNSERKRLSSLKLENRGLKLLVTDSTT